MAGPFIVGGAFQDSLSNPLKNGNVTLELSTDATDIATGTFQICHGGAVKYALDVNGNIQGSQLVWANSDITPYTYYRISAFAANGQLAWGPNNCFLINVGGFVNLDGQAPTNPA